MTMAGWAGLAFVVLALVGAFIAGSPPNPDASAAEIRDFFSDNRTALLWGGFLSTLAFPFFVGFVLVLARMMRKATGDNLLPGAMLFSAVASIVLAMGGAAVLSGMIWVDGLVDGMADDTVSYAWNTSALLYGATGITLFVLFGSVGVAIQRTKMMPATVGWLAGAAAVLSLVGTLSLLDADLGVLGFLSAIAGAAWVIVASIVMIGSKAAEPAPQMGAARA
jgi:hypothetical protein